MIGESAPILEIKRMLEKVAPTDSRVLITAEGDGVVKYVDAERIVIEYKRSEEDRVVNRESAIESVRESARFDRGSPCTNSSSTKGWWSTVPTLCTVTTCGCTIEAAARASSMNSSSDRASLVCCEGHNTLIAHGRRRPR